MKSEMKKILLILLLLGALSSAAVADPYGPDNITRDSDERRTSFGSGAFQVDAQAGNVTQLSINTSILTSRWQGYYGNISGSITLDNAAGWTLYDWSAGDLAVTGEIYAANQTISSWADVICVNFTGNGTVGHSGINVTQLEAMYGMTLTDGDGMDETFTTTDDIVIGETTLSNCPATHLYVNNATQTAQWNESLLTENATGAVIYASKVEQNTQGFDGNEWDFQMLVADDGDIAAATTYQFYVELV